MDYTDPFQGKLILILIDAHSKWVEAICTPGSTSTIVIDKLQRLPAQFGLLEMIVTDNGTCFVVPNLKPFSLTMESNISHRHHITRHGTTLPNMLYSL